MRVVFDTNVLLSACWNPEGLEAQMISLAIHGVCTACVSAAIWSEYSEVLSREKFTELHPRALHLLRSIKPHVCVVEPESQISAATDEADNRFLECAAAAEAAILITGNLKHFPAQWGPTRVMNARQFLTEFPVYLAA
jgi:putative PIN family toxin of toxin-antitoxin system